MAQIILGDDFNNYQNDSNDEIDVENDIFNYKGYFLENDIDEDEGPKYFEYGAHFPYLFLYQKLEILSEEQKEEEKELNNKNNKSIQTENEKNGKELNEETDIFSYFSNNTKKSRNRNNNNDNFTNQPFFNNNFNEIENNENNEIHDYQKIRTFAEQNKKISNEDFSTEKGKKNKNKNKNKGKKELNNKNNNISALISHNKYKEKTFYFFEKNLLAENMNLYTSFAKKLKMNRHFNFSKKDTNNEEEIAKINNSNSNKKIRSIQLSKEKVNKVIHSSTQSKNHLEKKIKTDNNTFKKSFSKSKEHSSSCNNNNNKNKINKKSIHNQLIANSLNNILACYKNKRNFKFSPSSTQPTKINNPCYTKKNYKNPNVSKNKNKNVKNEKVIKKICKEHSNSNSKKKLAISTEGKEINKHNNTQEIKNRGNNLVFNKTKMTEFHSKLLQEMIDSITSCSYNNKSRNKNTFGNNLTGTKSNLLTDREKRKGPYSINNKKNLMLQTQPVYINNKKELKNSNIVNDKNKNFTEKKRRTSESSSIKKKFNNNNNNTIETNKFKTYLDIKLNKYQKATNNILNELKKSIGIKNFTKQLNNNHKKNNSSSKTKNNNEKISRNVNNGIKNSKTNHIINPKINNTQYNDNHFNKIYNCIKKNEKNTINNNKNLSNNKNRVSSNSKKKKSKL